MSIQYRTVDHLGNILEVTNLIDKHGNEINDVEKAISCVVKLLDGHWLAASTDDVPIYTVH